MRLERVEMDPAVGPIPESVARWIDRARTVSKTIDCFDYIPSSPELLYAHLRQIPGKVYCEWGSGIGIGLGIAASLGFEAIGIELNEDMASASRSLLAECGLDAKVVCGSYHDLCFPADVVFVYCWPGQVNAVRARFESCMSATTWLLLAEGSERFSPHFLVKDSG